MTVVVADTSPLNYLLLVGEIAILPSLYGQVFLPPEVLAELSDADAPPQVLKWIQQQPAWLQVRHPRMMQGDAALGRLDPGERAAIILAQQELDVLLLIDDAAGRTEATRRGIPNTGTLGVLRGRRHPSTPGSSERIEELGRNQFPRLAKPYSGAPR
jgi:predicted nucleic acid-binding protein